MTFGEKIQKLRKEAGLSQEELACQLGVSRQAVSKWEVGDALPDTDKLVPLARALGITHGKILPAAYQKHKSVLRTAIVLLFNRKE